MKKFIYSCLVLAMTALTFSSCEDVPAPYNMPNQPETPSVDPNGKGSESNPYTVTEAIALIKDGKAPTSEVCVKGTITAVTYYNATYKSLSYNIADAGSSDVIEVYSGKGLNGADFSAKTDLSVGQVVVVQGILKAFTKSDGTVVNEIDKNSTIISIEGGGQTPEIKNDGSASKPYTVTEALSLDGKKNVYIKAYIVGSVTDKSYSSAEFGTAHASQTNLLVAASAEETDANKCMPVQLPTGKIRAGLNLKDNPKYYKKEVILYGEITKYFAVEGIKSVTYAKIENTEIGTKPSDSGDTTTTGDALNETFAESIGSFSIIDVDKGSLSYVWKHDATNKYMKASAYVNNANNAVSSWLVSQTIDLSKLTSATLTFTHALNFVKNGNRSDLVNVVVSTNYTGDVTTATWENITLDKWADGASWTFVDSKADLSKYAGKKITLAFKYTSSTEAAPTWEIKNVVIK